MGRERYSNAVATTLNGSITSSATSVVVNDGSTFPTQDFRVVCESEIMYCTSRSSNTLTVIRAQEGTSGASHASSTPINHVLTKGALDAIRLDLLWDMGLVPRVASVSADDDEFDDENFSGWTQVNTTPNPVIIEQNHRASIYIGSGGAAAQHYAWLKAKTPSPGDWVQVGFQYNGTDNQFPQGGPMMADGTTYGSGKALAFQYSTHENNFFLRDTNGFNSQANVNGYAAFIGDVGGVRHMKLVYKGSSQFDAFYSGDGISWMQVFTNQTQGTITPTQMGFCFSPWGSTHSDVLSVLYCRFSF